jgi:hypothetical protein
MRILSKFKDFYDYVVFETDNRKVYVRDTKNVVFNESNINETSVLCPITHNEFRNKYKGYIYNEKWLNKEPKWFIGCVGFCDKIRYYFQHENVIYWNYEDIPDELIKEISPRSKWGKYELKNYERYSWFRNPFSDMLAYKELGWVIDRHTKEPIKSDLNTLFNCPVVLIASTDLQKVILNPKLNDMGFNKIISPTEAYQDIYNWIPYNEPEVPSSPNDMSRYEAKGFDKKTSFRPNMKE